MTDTFTGLALTVLAVLPGALFTWAREQQTGRWGVALSDRLLRFLGASALFHALFLPLTYRVYRGLGATGTLAHGGRVSPWLWSVPPAYVLIPIVAGRALGVGIRRHDAWAHWITGDNPAPRAWDYVFRRNNLVGWVVLRLRSGDWVGGGYIRRLGPELTSYASGYPEQQDLFLADTVEVDQHGQLVFGSDGRPRALGRGLLIRWDEVSYLEFVASTQIRRSDEPHSPARPGDAPAKPGDPPRAPTAAA